jgi:uncharacterized membrane protein YbhN (UPF0104 family)
VRRDESVKPAPGKAGHASVLGVEDGSRESTSDTRLPQGKLRFHATLRQAGTRARIIFWLRLMVGLSILGTLLSRINLRAATVHPSPRLFAGVVGAAGLWIVSQSVAALRWKLVLNDDELPFSYLLRLYVIGAFFGLFLPTSVGGDAVRAMAVVRSSKRAGRAIASVLIDRGFGLLATFAFAMFGLSLAPDSPATLTVDAVQRHPPPVALLSVAIVAATLGLVVVRRSRRLQALWRDGVTTLGDLAQSPRRLGEVLGLAVLSQGVIVLVWYTLGRGMSFTIPVSTFIWAAPLVSLSAMLPVTFAGLGVREATWLVLLAGRGIPRADIVAFSLLYFACNVLVGIIGGILFVSQGLMVGASGRTLGQKAIDAT